MSTLLALCLVLTGRCLTDQSPNGPGPGFHQFREDLHREHLEATKRGIALLQSLIDLDEKLLAEHPDIFTLERASRMRKGVEEMRDELAKKRRIERELEL